ncbi:hypothetical protein B0T26DRAFT_753604 [Lasiosphaeria miniovina]|uniref:Uncharacterized protein n=1 Tax=Lasiosphaeria miniovina TaxID=1954250 RepID=A0AA40ACR9_9PEZI|nr:uncharacterized protein B0T26DRAFT_753604 [Lasiosphaeria miniovina]KAK0713506.1 hypothetical protein B0T26DRAFT_753604 [Lasiosphaeria miniovina]
MANAKRLAAPTKAMHALNTEIPLFVAQFDVEVKGWVTSDGKLSDCEARNGLGFVIFQPDRDLEVRVKRRW